MWPTMLVDAVSASKRARIDGAGAVEPGLVAVELEAHVGRAAERVELVGHLLGVGRGVEVALPPAPP